MPAPEIAAGSTMSSSPFQPKSLSDEDLREIVAQRLALEQTH
jgi:hypothetical protein